MSEWSRARVNIDYHVVFDANLYSVPYNLVHEMVAIRATPTTVEALHNCARVASHVRSRSRGQTITNHEHRPKSHQAHLEWTPSRMLCNGRRPYDQRRRTCLNGSWPTSRIRRWGIALSWGLSG